MVRFAWGALLALSCLACAPDASPPALEGPAPRAGLHLAGADEARPILLHLAQIFTIQEPGEALAVSALPQDGALRALKAGVIDGAILFDAEGGGVRVAETRGILLAGPGVGGRTLSPEALARIIRGEGAPWPSGQPARFLSRAPGAGAQAAFFTHPTLRAAARALEGRATHEDQGLRAALALTPGGIGFSDEGSAALYGSPLWRISVEGISPRLIIHLRLADDPPARLRRFADFVAGPEGRQIVQDLGYAP